MVVDSGAVGQWGMGVLLRNCIMFCLMSTILSIDSLFKDSRQNEMIMGVCSGLQSNQFLQNIIIY